MTQEKRLCLTVWPPSQGLCPLPSGHCAKASGLLTEALTLRALCLWQNEADGVFSSDASLSMVEGIFTTISWAVGSPLALDPDPKPTEDTF